MLALQGFAQDCDLTLNGYVQDADTAEPLEFVNIYIEESLLGTTTDVNGFFEVNNLCTGEYHITSSHIGCASKRLYFELHSDSTLIILMEHSATQLNSVVVDGKSKILSTQNNETIGSQEITDHASENLSNLLEDIAGVSTLKNGNGIAKPVVHGLYGNRLTILNNGVSQSGQQWGNDHSPEIDPLVANKIRVMKGTSALEYAGGNLGSIIMVEPKKIEREPHLHGSATYFFESNGMGNGANVQLQQYADEVAWKINGTIKKSGDKKAANYYLNNTGNEEANLALQLEKSFDSRLFLDFYASTFNTKLGVLRGAHIGNLNDLEEALDRTEPFYTEDSFSYKIEAPSQSVGHHLVKLHSKYFLKESQWIDITLAGQLNNRKEFDVRRSGRTDIPAMSLRQFSLFSELKFQKESDQGWTFKSGLQNNIIDNTNIPETGILPLIPDYLSYETAAFVVVAKNWESALVDFGVRYDNAIQNVVAISNSTPREIIRYNNIFHNANASLGFTRSLTKHQALSANIGFAMRNPAINELYSNGLHQGVSGIEEGDINLKTEKAVKMTLEYNVNFHGALTFESLLYYQRINDFIFLNPQDELRPTIRGIFPVFQYEQTDAEIFGLDLSTQINITHSLYGKLKYSFIKGNDRSNNIPLINMPSNNLVGSVGYQLEQPLKLGKKQIENAAFEITNRYVFQQSHLLPSQDFVSVPNAYYLLGLSLSGDIQLKGTRWRIIANLDNILNTAYRDYLNRQRYFADDLGINAKLGINVKF